MERRIRNFSLTLAVAGLCWLGAAAQTSPSSTTAGSSATPTQGSSSMSASDRTFVRKAAEGGLAEVELGKLAAERASSQDVKQFGQRMVDDHTKANDQLKQLASQKGISVPEKLGAKDAATKARLEKLSGKTFDRAYMRDMVTDHTKDVTEFRTEAKGAKDPDVKNFATQTVPTLEEHLKQAKSLAPQTARSHHHKAASSSGME
jgi:putative membrane protein